MTKKKIKHNKKAFYRPSEEEITEATLEMDNIIDYVIEKFPDADRYMVTKMILANLKPSRRADLTKKLGITNDNVIIAGWIFKELDKLDK